MKKIIPVLFLVLLFLSINGCKCHKCLEKEGPKTDVPEFIIKKANKFVMSRTGREFFKKNIRFDFLKSRKIKEGYFIRYNYVRTDYPFVHEPVYFTVDSTGKPLKKFGIVGIPDCLHEPINCIYKVNKAKAEEIARQENLGAGIKKWDVSFRWENKLNRYIWHIISTTKETGTGKHYKAEGEEIMINPSDGSILKKGKWYVR
jgi:hypothetical protein